MVYSEKVIQAIKNGQVGIMPTDTILGIVASIYDVNAVERVKRLKERSPNKSFIVLVSDISDIEDMFQTSLDLQEKKFAQLVWPGEISIVFSLHDTVFLYVHPGHIAPAIRIPANNDLRILLKQTGPIIATSVNMSEKQQINSTVKAKSIFKDTVDFYVDDVALKASPSTVVGFVDRTLQIIRNGSYDPNKIILAAQKTDLDVRVS